MGSKVNKLKRTRTITKNPDLGHKSCGVYQSRQIPSNHIFITMKYDNVLIEVNSKCQVCTEKD